MARKQSDLFGLEREEAVRKQKIKLAAIGGGILALLIVIFVVVRIRSAGPKQTDSQAESSVESAEVTAVPEETLPPQTGIGTVRFPQDPSYTQKITIMGTGDNLIHEAIYEDAESDSEEGYYDFRPMYELVKPYIEAADMATINMETPLATSIGKPSGYPHFNSPRGAGYVLLDSGFDVINHANNHVMDMGVEGLYATLDYWAQYDMPVVGAYRSRDDMYTMRILQANGISVAFLGFADFTNYDIPESSSAQVPFLSDGDLVKDLIETAKSKADVVVVHAHWGEENEDVVTDTMDVMSQKMVDWGADIIFGNHTHIVQDLKVLTRESDGQLCPVILSNGNFISGQKERAHLLSGLEYVTVAKNPEDGKIEIQNVQYLPIVTHYEGDRKNVKLYPLDQYTDELAAAHGVVEFEGEPMTIRYLEDLLQQHIPNQFRATTKSLQLPSGLTSSASSEAAGETAESGSAASESEDVGTEQEEESEETEQEEESEEMEQASVEEPAGEQEDEEERSEGQQSTEEIF